VLPGPFSIFRMGPGNEAKLMSGSLSMLPSVLRSLQVGQG